MLWLRFAPAARASKGRRDQGKGTRSTPSAVSVRDGRDRDAGRAPLERREKGLGDKPSFNFGSLHSKIFPRESLCSKGCPGLPGGCGAGRDPGAPGRGAPAHAFSEPKSLG